MPVLNNWVFEGKAGADAVVAGYGNEGKRYGRVNIAVNQFEKGEATTIWVSVVSFFEHTVTALENVKKGSSVRVQGRLTQNSFKGKDGVERTGLGCNADAITLLESTKGNGAAKAADSAEEETPRAGRATRSKAKVATNVEDEDITDAPF